MKILKIQSLKALRAEMTAVASGEKKAPADASQISFESAEAVARLLPPENRVPLAVMADGRQGLRVARGIAADAGNGFMDTDEQLLYG